MSSVQILPGTIYTLPATIFEAVAFRMRPIPSLIVNWTVNVFAFVTYMKFVNGYA